MTRIPIMPEEEWTLFPKDVEGGYGTVQTEKGNFPLKKMKIESVIVGLSARTHLSQTFQNSFKEALEATYIFPLPPGGAVQNFRVQIGDREILGTLKERGEARQEFEEAIAQGHSAAIVEEERPDIFTLRVGNIAPQEEMTIHFDVVELLTLIDGEVTFRFPLVVPPKYIPGTPLLGTSAGDGIALDTDAVPDASRISPPTLLPGTTNPVALSIEVRINGMGHLVENLRSSLHTIQNISEDEHHIELVCEEGLNRDFILRFQLGQTQKPQFLLSPDNEGSGGTFALTIIPKTRSTLPHRDVVFILDRSGSMDGWKMVAARRAIGRMVDSLNSNDRFSVMAFNTSIEYFMDDDCLIKATNRNRFRAVEWLAKVGSQGGTEIMKPMIDALQSLKVEDPSRVRSVVLVTDGQVGNENEILRAIAPLVESTRIHTIGIDEAVSEAFLQGLARAGQGRCELVESEDRLDESMDRIHRTIGDAAMTDLELYFSGIKVDKDSLPSRLPDVYEGIATVILGRYKEAKSPKVTIQASVSESENAKIDVAGNTNRSSSISAIWARRHIRKLEDLWNIGNSWQSKNNNQDAIEKELIETSIRFGVLSRFTSFVAVDRDSKVTTKGSRRVVQPVEVTPGPQMLTKAMAPSGVIPSMVRAVHSMMAPVPQSRRRMMASKPGHAESFGASASSFVGSSTRASAGSSIGDEMLSYDGFSNEIVNDMEVKSYWLATLLFRALTGLKFSGNLDSIPKEFYTLLHEILLEGKDDLYGFTQALKTKASHDFRSPVALEGLLNTDRSDALPVKLTALYLVSLELGIDANAPLSDIWVYKHSVSLVTPPNVKKKPFWKR